MVVEALETVGLHLTPADLAEPNSEFLYTYEELMGTSARPPMVVDEILYERHTTLLFAPTGFGKSLMAVSVGAHIATGRPFAGLAVKQGPVYYVAAEDPESIKRRWRAYQTAWGVDLRDFHVVKWAVDFSEDEGMERFLAFLESCPPGTVILDPLSDLAGLLNINDSGRDARVIIRRLKTILAMGHSVVLVHHTGKDVSKDEAGAFSFAAHAKVRLALKFNKHTNVVEATVRKNREGRDGAKLSGRIETVDVDGEAVAMYVPVTFTPPQLSNLGSSGASDRGPAALRGTAAHALEVLKHLAEGPGFEGVTQTDWLRKTGAAAGVQPKSGGFSKVVDRLVENGQVISDGRGRGALYRLPEAA